jgi:hypothetical protein
LEKIGKPHKTLKNTKYIMWKKIGKNQEKMGKIGKIEKKLAKEKIMIFFGPKNQWLEKFAILSNIDEKSPMLSTLISIEEKMNHRITLCLDHNHDCHIR